MSPPRPCPFFPPPCFLLRSMYRLHRTWLYSICVHKALPCPAGLQRPALEKCKVFCCSDKSLAGLRIGLIMLAALSDPHLCCSTAFCLTPEPLCARRLPLPLAHQLCFHSQSLPSAPLASKPLSSRPATCCSQPSFIFSSLPVEMPF